MRRKSVAHCLARPVGFEHINPARKNRSSLTDPGEKERSESAAGRYPVLDYAAEWWKSHKLALDSSDMEQPPDTLLDPQFPAYDKIDYYASLVACIFPAVNEAMRVLREDAALSLCGHLNAQPVPGNADFHVTSSNGKIVAEGDAKITHQIHTRRKDQWYSLLRDPSQRKRERVAKTASQAVMYSVINMTQYCFIANNLYWVIMWRGERTERKEVWFSQKIPVNLNIEHAGEQLTLRIIIASQVFKASKEGKSMPMDSWAQTPESIQKWSMGCQTAAVLITWPREEEEAQGEQAGEGGGDDDDQDDGDGGEGGEEYDDEDIQFDGEGEEGGQGPDQGGGGDQTGGQEGQPPGSDIQQQSLDTPSKEQEFAIFSGAPVSGIDHLPETPYHLLQAGRLLSNNDGVMVREGCWSNELAILKMVDISNDNNMKFGLARQICALEHLQKHEVESGPKVVACGQCFEGLLKWVAMTPAGDSLAEAKLDFPVRELHARARASLAAIHDVRMLHGNPVAENLLVRDGKVSFSGFSKARLSEKQEDYEEELAELERSIQYWEDL